MEGPGNITRPFPLMGCPTAREGNRTNPPRMEHITPNSPSDALFFPPTVDQWSAPAHAIANVLTHVRTTGRGSTAIGGSVHLN